MRRWMQRFSRFMTLRVLDFVLQRAESPLLAGFFVPARPVPAPACPLVGLADTRFESAWRLRTNSFLISMPRPI